MVKPLTIEEAVEHILCLGADIANGIELRPRSECEQEAIRILNKMHKKYESDSNKAVIKFSKKLKELEGLGYKCVGDLIATSGEYKNGKHNIVLTLKLNLED